MKRIVLALCLVLFSTVGMAQPFKDAKHPVKVKTYTKKDGTIIKQHYRAKPHHKG